MFSFRYTGHRFSVLAYLFSLQVAIRFVIVVAMASAILLSCVGNDKVSKYIDERMGLLSQNDIEQLNTIAMQDLYDARDSSLGTLYYAGLLWYFNDQKDKAEVAWKRAARTGASPWKEESRRLVAYHLTNESRYNQIAPFIDEVASTHDIMQDPELFSYYTRGLWSSKDRTQLKKLLSPSPDFRATLRNRVNIAQANFYYDMWKTILAIENFALENPNANNIVAHTESLLLDLYLGHSMQYADSNLMHYISGLNIAGLDMDALEGDAMRFSEPLQSLISLRDSNLNNADTLEIYLSLPNEYYNNIWIILDMLDAAKGSRLLSRRRALKKLESLELHNTQQTSTRGTDSREIDTKQKNTRGADNLSAQELPQILLLLAKAEIYFRNNDYRNSYKYYYKMLQSLNTIHYNYEKDPQGIASILYSVQWRYLYNTMSIAEDEFFPEFIRISQNTGNPAFFANLLEEYLSLMLRDNKYKKIIREYTKYRTDLTSPAQQAELLRWESIIARIDDNDNFDIDINRISQYEVYLSDLPFDYLINHSTIDKGQFIADWTGIGTNERSKTAVRSGANSKASRSTSKSNKKSDSLHSPTTKQSNKSEDNFQDKIIQGYTKYGLINYGYSVALENAQYLSPQTLVDISEALYKIGNISQSLTLMRIAASYDKSVLEDENTLRLLYPIPYFDIVERTTRTPIEQALLMGLMREESSFDYNAQSPAYARGLTQLLMPTAIDIAERIDFSDPIRLENPDVNITLGYHYLKYLIRVLKSPLKAILSYNGGLGNVWKWEDKYNTNNLILFAETLPVRETRNYLRKVSSSAMIYGLLYFDVTPQEFQKYLLKEY